MSSLALQGGEPVRESKIPLHIPYIGEEEARAAADIIRSGWISGDGKKCREFEAALAKYLKVKYAFFTNSCTAGLHLGLMAANIYSGEVISPAYTFTSTALVALLNQARSVLADVGVQYGNLTPQALSHAISLGSKAVIPVHYAGIPCDMDEINKIAKEHGLFVMEDAAQALGSEYKGKKAGNLADVGCFSFHSTKNITCGEGGAIVTNNSEIAEKIMIMRDKGTDKFRKDFQIREGKKEGYYDYVSVGNSYVQSDILAGVALEQFRKIDKIHNMRAKIANQFTKGLQEANIKLPNVPANVKPNWHLYLIQVPREKRDWFVRALHAEGVGANRHYFPLNRTTLYQKHGYKDGDFPGSEAFSDSLVRLPIYPNLSKDEIDDIIKAVAKVSKFL
jgi:perosamine synthetase